MLKTVKSAKGVTSNGSLSDITMALNSGSAMLEEAVSRVFTLIQVQCGTRKTSTFMFAICKVNIILVLHSIQCLIWRKFDESKISEQTQMNKVSKKSTV